MKSNSSGRLQEQTCDNQLLELRRYVDARGWQSAEFVDNAHSGAKESRPALDALMKAVHRRQVDVVVVVALDRLGRSLGHLVRIIEDWQKLGVSLVSLRDGLDLSSASGRLQLHILAALAQFERERVRERVLAGPQRARAQGKRLGRPRAHPAVLAWTALPLGLATVGMLSSLSRWMGPIWLCTGGLFGFVVLGAWSLGLFYSYGALVMFTAALIHLVAVRPGWRAVLAPLWMLAGAGGVSTAFFLRDVLQSSRFVHVTHAPIVVWGSWLFVAMSVLLLLFYGLLGLRHSAS